MEITSARPFVPEDKPQLPPQEVRQAAMTSHLAHQLGGAAPSGPSVGAAAPPSAPPPVGSTQTQTTDVTLQALYDIAQLHMLYSQATLNPAAIAAVYTDLQSLVNNAYLYNQNVTIAFGSGGTTVITLNPLNVVQTVLSFQTLADPQTTFYNAFLNQTAYVPPQTNQMPPLDECIYAMISESNTDDDFDFNFSTIDAQPTQLMDIAESYLIIASLMNVPAIASLANLDNFWAAPGEFGANYQVFPEVMMAAIILNHSTLNADGSIASTDMAKVNTDLAAFQAMLPAPATDGSQPNYAKMYNTIHGLSCNYTNIGSCWRAVGLPINIDYRTVRTFGLDCWDTTRENLS